jgi:hypothetical protein
MSVNGNGLQLARRDLESRFPAVWNTVAHACRVVEIVQYLLDVVVEQPVVLHGRLLKVPVSIFHVDAPPLFVAKMLPTIVNKIFTACRDPVMQMREAASARALAAKSARISRDARGSTAGF